MNKIVLLSLLTFSLICSCGVKKHEYNKVIAQRDSLQIITLSLEREIEILKNGED